MYEIRVEHQTSTGHRVLGHEGGKGKCARLHGHTYLFDVRISSDRLTDTGFVVDFGIVKATLDEWDHRMVLSDRDPLVGLIVGAEWGDDEIESEEALEREGIVVVPFNPTAENMSKHLTDLFSELDGVQYALAEVHEGPKTMARWV